MTELNRQHPTRPKSAVRERALLLVLAAASSAFVVTYWGVMAALTSAATATVVYAITARGRAAQMERVMAGMHRSKFRLERQMAERLVVEDDLREEVASAELQREELERAREQAESASNVKSVFLANMSHEIRTPMNGIIGMAELMLDTDLSSDQRDFAKTIFSSGKGLLRILNDILDFSKIEAGKLELESHEFRLRPCLQGVVELLFSVAKDKGLELTCLVHSSVPDHLAGDSTRLRQVLLNLIGNAVKFTASGQVALEVTLKERTDEGVVLRFAVSDTGIGIPADKQRDLFRPFTQLDESITRKYGGTGLGLAISSQLAQMMGGGLGVDSIVGSGSTFYLDATFDVEAQPGEQDDELDQVSGRRMLIIDPSETSRRVLREYGTGFGMTVEEAGGHASGLSLLQNAVDSGAPFDFALINAELDGMAGKEFASVVKSRIGLKGTALILMNTLGLSDKPSSLARAGLDAWLSKPIGADKLKGALVHVMTDATDSPAPSTSQPIREDVAPDLGATVLLVEDNLVNQKVGCMLLRRLGCEVDVANHGKEAVERLTAKHYDVIFMDCQMPIMSGFEATAAIRALDSDRRDTPIVAMTANAMTGDRERCLRAGMNDYLSKPVQKSALAQSLERWIQDVPSTNTTMNAEMSDNNNDQILDRDVIESLLELSGDDEPSLFAELVDLFLSDTPVRIADMVSAFENADAGGVERAAHALKSSAANLGAIALSELFRDLEGAGRDGDLARASGLISNANPEFVRVEHALKAQLGSNS